MRNDLPQIPVIVYNGSSAQEWYEKFAHAVVQLEQARRTIEQLTEEPFVLERDLRRAIDPVAHWFDLDGEEGSPVTVIEAIELIAKYLHEDRQSLLRYQRTLRNLDKVMSQYGGAEQLSIRVLREHVQKALKEDDQDHRS